MTASNFTGDENQKTLIESFCLAQLPGQAHNHLTFLFVVDICLSITAFMGNSLILVALHKESSLHLPSKLLYRSLAGTDFCVGITVVPFAATHLIAVMNQEWNICGYAFDSNFITSYILCLVSLLTLTAISVDRLLALLLGLRYRQVVTLKRTYLAVIVFWVVSIVGTTMYFWDPLITSWYGNIVAVLCQVTSAFSYINIFLTLRHNRAQIQNHVSGGQPSQAIPLNIARYRKAVSSALWVQVTLAVCYLPYGIQSAFTPQRGLSLSFYLARQYAATLIYLNSSLNPLLYCWRIREVRQAVKDTIRQFSCSSS